MATHAESIPVRRSDPGRVARRITGRVLIYAALLFWTFVSLFPIYWTITTSFKVAVDIQQGHLIPWVSFDPEWLGWRALGLSPDTIFEKSTAREEFLKRFQNSLLLSVGASTIAVGIGALAAYGLARFEYKFLIWRNRDISFWFLSQLILPPMALAMPLLVLYKELALLDSRIGMVMIYTLMVLPIVIWIMRDQFGSIPIELEQAALVDGSTTWGRVPANRCADRGAGRRGRVHHLGHHLLERVHLRSAADQHDRQDPAGRRCESNRFAGHQLVVDGRDLDRRHCSPGPDRHCARALHRQRFDRRRCQVISTDKTGFVDLCAASERGVASCHFQGRVRTGSYSDRFRRAGPTFVLSARTAPRSVRTSFQPLKDSGPGVSRLRVPA